MINKILLSILDNLTDQPDYEYDLIKFINQKLYEIFSYVRLSKFITRKFYEIETEDGQINSFLIENELLKNFWRCCTKEMDENEEVYSNGTIFLHHKITKIATHERNYFYHEYHLYYDERNREDRILANKINVMMRKK